MKTKIIIFEGFGDQESGFEFDMPIYMIKPIKKYCDEAGSIYHAENMIEDYLIDLSLGDNPKNEEMPKTIINQFYRARDGKAGKNIIYWKCKVTINGDIANDDCFINGIVNQEDIEYFIKGKKLGSKTLWKNYHLKQKTNY